MKNYAYKGNPITFKTEIYPDLIPYLGGINENEYFTNIDALIMSHKKQLEFIPSVFGDTVAPLNPAPAHLSYGHLVCIGATIKYSETAEPNVTPTASSVEEAIEMLEKVRGMDFTKHPFFLYYAEMLNRLREAFPEREIAFSGFGNEGPITSCALFRGQDFYMDLYDEPELTKRYIYLMTESICEFKKQINVYNGLPPVTHYRGYLCDDCASFLNPSMWEEFVIPYWEQYYSSLTTSTNRFLHCESARREHLPYLAKAKITHYQPSVSPMLTLDDMKNYLPEGITFDWLLYAWELTKMTDEQIAAWIDAAVEAGAITIRTQFNSYTVKENKLDRVKAYLKAADKYAVE